MTYAIKIGGKWYLAVKAKNAIYRLDPPGKDVWSEYATTALICEVGREEKAIPLD